MILQTLLLVGVVSAWNGPCMNEDQMKRFLNFTNKLDANFDKIDVALDNAAKNETHKSNCTKMTQIKFLQDVVTDVRADTTLNQTKMVDDMCNDFDKTLSNLAVAIAPINKMLKVLEPDWKNDPSHKAITKAVRPLSKAIHNNMHQEPNYPRTISLLQAHTGRSLSHLGEGYDVPMFGDRPGRHKRFDNGTRFLPRRPCLNNTEREHLVEFVEIGVWGVDIAELSVEATAFHKTDPSEKHTYAVAAKIIHDANEYIVREVGEILEDMVNAPGSDCSTCKDFFDDLIEVLEAVEDFCLEIASDSSSLEENPIFKVSIDSVDLGISIGNIEFCLKVNQTEYVDDLMAHPFDGSKYSAGMDLVADKILNAAGVVTDDPNAAGVVIDDPSNP